MIKLAGFVDLAPAGTRADALRQMMKETEFSLGIREEPLPRDIVRGLIKEELARLNDDLAQEYPIIRKKLETLRMELLPDMLKQETTGASFKMAGLKRLHMSTVSELLDIPVNYLQLYGLNELQGSRAANEHQLVEFGMQTFTFYLS